MEDKSPRRGNKTNEAISELTQFVDKRMKQTVRDIKKMERAGYQQIVSYLDLRAIVGSDVYIPPLRGHAVSPDTAVFLWHLLNVYRPKSILDLGSGVSSALFATFSKRMGGRCLSVDHLPKFVEETRVLVQSWGTSEKWDIIQADINEQDGGLFYDLRKVKATRRRFDFLFLDGPPKYVDPNVRGNLLPLFLPVLKKGCIIVMDDYYRDGENAAVKQWVDAGLVEILQINTVVEKQAAVMRLGSSQQ